MHSDDNKSEPTSWCASLQILGRNVREKRRSEYKIVCKCGAHRRYILYLAARLHWETP
jgi:hypothetical protein